jgi:hypothetical protein
MFSTPEEWGKMLVALGQYGESIQRTVNEMNLDEQLKELLRVGNQAPNLDVLIRCLSQRESKQITL